MRPMQNWSSVWEVKRVRNVCNLMHPQPFMKLVALIVLCAFLPGCLTTASLWQELGVEDQGAIAGKCPRERHPAAYPFLVLLTPLSLALDFVMYTITITPCVFAGYLTVGVLGKPCADAVDKSVDDSQPTHDLPESC